MDVAREDQGLSYRQDTVTPASNFKDGDGSPGAVPRVLAGTADAMEIENIQSDFRIFSSNSGFRGSHNLEFFPISSCGLCRN